MPTREAALLALRTQQVIAHESGVPAAVDPFGGSYFLETLTGELESGAREYVDKIDALGGMVPAIEAGYPQREIANSAYRTQQAIEAGEQTVVGVNRYADESPPAVETLYIDESTAARQSGQLARTREARDPVRVGRTLDVLRRTAADTGNLMPPLIEAVRAHATLGEMCAALRDVWGEYEEAPSV